MHKVKNTLYIFIDESGNFDFSPHGTRHFVLTAVSTFFPLASIPPLYSVRYELMTRGFEQEMFHATEDKQYVRNRVFEKIHTLSTIEVDTVVADKSAINSRVDQDETFYQQVAEQLLFFLFQRHAHLPSTEHIIIVLGSLFTNKKRKYIIKFLREYLKKIAQQPFFIYFHSVKCDMNLQIADYCGWAVYVDASRNEHRPLQVVQHLIKKHSTL